MSNLSKFYEFVDTHENDFVARLKEAVEIQSVSGIIERRGDVRKMANFLEGEFKNFKNLKPEVTLVELGKQAGHEDVDLPPVILAHVGKDSNKKTILCYGHYDVQPATKDGWDSDPWALTEKNGQMYGRGSSDDKGPVLGWINVLQAHDELKLELPVNLKLCFEGMEESGSDGLDKLIHEHEFFRGLSAVCITDNTWINTQTPCLTHGVRGIMYYRVTVSGPTHNLHSGAFGGMIHEPMTDLIQLMGKLVASNGKILIPGINELVDPVTPEERKLYEAIDYSLKDLRDAVGAEISLFDDKISILMGRMRYPCLSLHGIDGDDPGENTIIPAKVSGKFSIRLVPSQNPKIVGSYIKDYLNKEFEKLGTKNKIEIEETPGSGEAWVANNNHWNYKAGKQATETVYRKEPNLTREGGSVPVTLTFSTLQKPDLNVMMLPMGQGDDNAHSTNEKLSRCNFLKGTKLFGTYLYEAAKV